MNVKTSALEQAGYKTQPSLLKIEMPFFHPCEEWYETFVQAVKGYGILGPMRVQGGPCAKPVGR